jgi:hypothetical protein
MVQRLNTIKPSPKGGAQLRKPDGTVYLKLPETPYTPSTDDERKIDPETGYFGKTVEQLKQGQ